MGFFITHDMSIDKPSLPRLLGVALYDSLILIALCMLGTALYTALLGRLNGAAHVWGLRVFLWLLVGAYFCWCWVKSGQTLAAKTWRVRLVQQNGTQLTLTKAIFRYALATASLLACGVGYLCALWDKQRMFLHDRIAKTRFEAVL